MDYPLEFRFEMDKILKKIKERPITRLQNEIDKLSSKKSSFETRRTHLPRFSIKCNHKSKFQS